MKFPYFFKFAALTEGTFNGVFYPNEELNKESVLKSFKNVPITINHSDNVTDKVGETVEIWWNDNFRRIEGRGKIEDTKLGREVADAIDKKLITNVSVEVLVKYEKTEKGTTARELEGVGLSLVLRGACKPPQCGIIETSS